MHAYVKYCKDIKIIKKETETCFGFFNKAEASEQKLERQNPAWLGTAQRIVPATSRIMVRGAIVAV